MNIFGGNTDMTYEELQRKRAVAEQLSKSALQTPRNVGEGISAIGKALAARSLNRKADARDAELRGTFNDKFAQVAPNTSGLVDLANSPYATKANQQVISALLKGAPNYRDGTKNHRGGVAVVGEDGPEVVQLPSGASVIPNDELPLELYDPESQQRLMQPGADTAPEPLDMRQLIGAATDGDQSRFLDDQAYQTADMSDLKPSGVGEQSQLNAAARSFQGLMQGLQDYEQLFAEGGATAWPGQRKDQLSTAHRDLQMQMKELYNLGVLNGPDLDLMNQILLDPTSISGNIMDAVGISDMEKRIPANIQDVRRMMTNRTRPALQQLGISPDDLMPKPAEAPDLGGLSDEDILKQLMGG